MKQRDFLQAQKVEMDRMLVLAAGDPLATFALQQRREDAEAKLSALPPRTTEVRAVLFFSGTPVYGSQGIDAQFAAGVLGPFLEMVKTQYAASKHGRVGTRGPRRDESEARLMLTGLPRGSFGLELSKPDSDELFGNVQLSDTLVHLTDVIRSAAQDDETFAVAFEKVSPRVLQRLRDFLKAISDGNASVRVVSGDLECQLDQARVVQAFERVNSAESVEETVEKNGVFRGATLDSWRFDFRSDDEETISGRLDEHVTDDQAAAMLELTNRPSKASLRRISVRTRSGIVRVTYELLAIGALPQMLPDAN
jgi:hypothetical protein